jgi:nitric oxide synthase oxygenase domain/subunit
LQPIDETRKQRADVEANFMVLYESKWGVPMQQHHVAAMAGADFKSENERMSQENA